MPLMIVGEELIIDVFLMKKNYYRVAGTMCRDCSSPTVGP